MIQVHVSDEVLVDLIRGVLETEKADSVAEHLRTCIPCAQKHEEWKQLLQAPASFAQPSPRLKRRILRDLRKRDAFRRLRLRPIGLLPALAVLFMAGIALLNLKALQGTEEPMAVSVKEMQPFFQVKSRQYAILPVSSEGFSPRTPIRGYAWINDETNEMLILFNGLSPLHEQDYQVWIQTPAKSLKNAGLIQMEQGIGKLYVPDIVHQEIEEILISIEPRGGSLFPNEAQSVRMLLTESR